jgi:hypothetical protein
MKIENNRGNFDESLPHGMATDSVETLMKYKEKPV